MCCGNCNTLAPPTSADLADASAVHAEIGSDIVLPIAAREHPFHNRDFLVIQRHGLASKIEPWTTIALAAKAAVNDCRH
jgi:hypothetical protein